MVESKFTNKFDIPLGLALWLATDDYDYQEIPKYISATTLMKPARQILLGNMYKDAEKEPTELNDLISSRLGTAIHDAVEKAWLSDKALGRLASLGVPAATVENVLINPDKKDIKEDSVVIHLEQRGYKKVQGYTIGGKFDMCIDGVIHDIKTTTTYGYMNGSKDEDYMIQGSIYRYLFPELVQEDFIRIMFVFTDWQSMNAKINPMYPPSRIAYRDIPLMSLEETHKWITDKISTLIKHENSEDKDLPLCSPEELWISETVFKYYSDGSKQTKATKNFTDYSEALQYQREKDKKGISAIVEFKAEPKRCLYCPVFNVCTQKDKYFNE